MSKEHSVSRRASLKRLGAVGAAMVFGRAAEASTPSAEPKPAKSDQRKQAVSTLDLAISRFGKGHSCAQAVFSAFADRFKAKHRALNCRDLLGCDLSTPEGRQTAKDKNLHATVCNGIVRDAAKTLNELLNEAHRGAAG